MATLDSSVPTLANRAKMLDPNGKVARQAMILSQKNMMLEDIVFKEGNLPTGERVVIETGLPDSYYRMINAGVPPTNSTSVQVDEQCAELVAYAEVDKTLAKLNGNLGEFRAQKIKSHLEGMSQTQAQNLVYGDASDPAKYVGFAPRYSSTAADNGENIILGGGSGADNTSIFLVGWGLESIYGIFPKGSQAGLSHQDLGEVTLETTNSVAGARSQIYRDHLQWNMGLVVKDWRYGVRIPNIDVSDLVAQTGTQALTASTSIIKLMSRAIDHLPDMTGVKPAFYVNRTVASHLRIIALEKSSSAVTVEPAINQFGQSIHQLTFLGIPVRIMDKITNAETLVA